MNNLTIAVLGFAKAWYNILMRKKLLMPALIVGCGLMLFPMPPPLPEIPSPAPVLAYLLFLGAIGMGLQVFLHPVLQKRPGLLVPVGLPLTFLLQPQIHPSLFGVLPILAAGIFAGQLASRLPGTPVPHLLAGLVAGLVSAHAAWMMFDIWPPASLFRDWQGLLAERYWLLFIPSTLWLLCARKPWQPFMLPMVRGALLLLLGLAPLYPLYLTALNSLKTHAEIEKDPRASPLPRYRPHPEADPADALPAELAGPHALDLLRLIHERMERLSPESLHRLFREAPLDPPEMVRVMIVYGLMEEDRHGPHVPSAAFTLDPSEWLAEEYWPWVERFREHARVNPDEVDPVLFREAIRRGIFLRVAPGDPRHRLSANFRRPFENGLRTRQILSLFPPHSETMPWSIETYAEVWGLSPFPDAVEELTQLRDMGFLDPVPISTAYLTGPVPAKRGLSPFFLTKFSLLLAGTVCLLFMARADRRLQIAIALLAAVSGVKHLAGLPLETPADAAAVATLTLFAAVPGLMLLVAAVRVLPPAPKIPKASPPSPNKTAPRSVTLRPRGAKSAANNAGSSTKYRIHKH